MAKEDNIEGNSEDKGHRENWTSLDNDVIRQSQRENSAAETREPP